LSGALVRHADFAGAELKGADLRGSILLESDLREARVAGAVFDETTKLPMSEELALARGMIKQAKAP
jgi:uncharacterized protein YjbI with pentapeptide repeats